MTTEYIIEASAAEGIDIQYMPRRYLKQNAPGGTWQLKDENYRNIRTFADIGDAMRWIDEERRGV
jgi:hypothetical protein